MPKPTGPVIRFYRRAYHQTTAHLYQGIMPRQNFSKYEKGTYDASVDKFLKLCLRLGASMSDIEKVYIQSDEKDEGDNEGLLGKFYQYYEKGDFGSLNALTPLLDEAYQETKFLKYARFRQLCEVLANDGDVHELFELLLNKKAWFILDSWTMYYLFPMLTLRERIQLLDHFCQSTNTYNQLRIRNAVIRHDTPDLCFQMVVDALTAEDTAALQDSIDLLRKIAPREHETFPFFGLQLIDVVIEAGVASPSHEKLDEIVCLYQLIGETQLAERMTTFWNLLLSRKAFLEVAK